MNWYGFLADLIVAFHVAYIGYIILGQLVILIGLAFGWRWVRNAWFRLTHLAAIVFVGVEALIGMDCPLTVWEADYRRLAGLEVAEGSFIGRALHHLIFYDASPTLLNALHVGFAVLVLATFILAPPRWRRRSPARST
jgi:hypothetical protein